MLITEEYREMNKQLHAERQDYGAFGSKWAGHVRELAEALKTSDVLDYGCGKGTLALNLPWPIRQYDPAVPAFADRPEPADLVVCTDVLEHIEIECLDALLDDLRRVTLKVLVSAVATRPAKKKLPDGRNAHLIIQPIEWWLPKLMQRFTLRTLQNVDEEFFAVFESHARA